MRKLNFTYVPIGPFSEAVRGTVPEGCGSRSSGDGQAGLPDYDPLDFKEYFKGSFQPKTEKVCVRGELVLSIRLSCSVGSCLVLEVSAVELLGFF